MLVATIALGATTLSLLNASPADPSPTPKPTAEPSPSGKNAPQTVRGYEVTIHSDLAFGDLAMSDTVDGRYTLLVAPLSWEDESAGIDASFEITAYDSDGRIIDRTPTSTYVLPGQDGFFRGIFSEDLSDAVRITVEQTRAETGAPPMTGAITLTHTETLEKSTDEGRKVYVGGNLTSTLSVVPTHPDVFFAGYVDGELFGYCDDMPDIPAGGDFTAVCALTPVTRDEHLLDGRLPKGAEFRVYLKLDAISEGL